MLMQETAYAVSPGPFIAQAIFSPSDFLTSFDLTSLAFSRGSPTCSMHLCGCLVCQYLAVFLMVDLQSSWNSGSLGRLKSALLAEECMDTLLDILHFLTHLGILGCTCLRQSVGILRGMASTLWISLRVWNHLHRTYSSGP